MKKNDEETDVHKKLWAPFEALKSLLDIEGMSEERVNAINESIVADIIGDEPKPPPPSEVLNQTATHLYYSILNLHSSIGRFETYKKMFQYYPWRGKISQADHIQSAYYLFVHECYILEERLKKFFRASRAYAREQGIHIDINITSKTVMKMHKLAFGSAIRARGVHVHVDDFVPRDIKRLGFLNLMILGDKDPVWKLLQKSGIRDVKKAWVRQCELAGVASEQIVATAFTATEPVWRHLASLRRPGQ